MALYVVLLLGFAVGGALSLVACVLGLLGKACDASVGYVVPERVRHDRQLRAQANGLIAYWAGGAAVMSLPPLLPLWSAIRADDPRALTTPGLAVVAAYGLVVVGIAHYPFARIERLGL